MRFSLHFSELDQLETKEERQTVYKQALKNICKRPQFWLYMFIGTVIFPAVAGFIFAWFGRAVPLSPMLKGGLIGGVVGGSLVGSWPFVFRSAIQKEIRLEMVARGVSVCMGCGYDLRGQVEQRCPECGRVFS